MLNLQPCSTEPSGLQLKYVHQEKQSLHQSVFGSLRGSWGPGAGWEKSIFLQTTITSSMGVTAPFCPSDPMAPTSISPPSTHCCSAGPLDTMETFGSTTHIPPKTSDSPRPSVRCRKPQGPDDCVGRLRLDIWENFFIMVRH